MASIPSRVESLRAVVANLSPQARQLGVYLNGYPEVPDFLSANDRVIVARSQDHGDVRDNGKFFFLKTSGARYYATVDDDINYPPDYIARLVEFHSATGKTAAVGVHASLYPSPIIDLVRSRYLLHFSTELAHALPVHLLGTGTVLFNQAVWNLRFEEFGEPGMADVWFARAASNRGAPLFAIPRAEGWLTPFEAKGSDVESMGGALFYEALIDGALQANLLQDAGASTTGLHGLVGSILASDRLAEDFTLQQAALLASIRKRIGLAPLTQEQGAGATQRITECRQGWNAVSGLTEMDISAHSVAVGALLSESLTTNDAIAALDLLERVNNLPYSLRASMPVTLQTDAQMSRLADTRVELVSRAVRTDREGAARLWSYLADHTQNLRPYIVLDFERASVDTRFIKHPMIRGLARRDPKSAASHVYEYLEARRWLVPPTVSEWKDLFGLSFNTTEVQMLLAMSAVRSGDTNLASQVSRRLLQKSPDDTNARLLRAAIASWSTNNTLESLSPVFSVLDDELNSLGLRPYLSIVDHHHQPTDHWIDLFLSPTRGSEINSTPRVTVIMTTYNQARTLPGAIAAVLASDGVALELVIVDDASSDTTPDFLSTVDDPRVTVVRNPVNMGPYGSRNRGLAHATGEFVAIADADDWSHPDRLRFQCGWLVEHPDHMACTVAHIRLVPTGKPDLENHMLFLGDAPVSLVFRRLLTEHIGGFGNVRTRGDIEFMRRVRARFGDASIKELRAPLLLATSSPASNSKAYSAQDLNLYRGAFRTWHRALALSDALYIDPEGGPAPFIVPFELRGPSPEL